jgi:hypothetical protein
MSLANHLTAGSQVPTLDKNWLARHMVESGLMRTGSDGNVAASICQLLNTPLLLVDPSGSRAAEVNFMASDAVLVIDASTGDVLTPLSEASYIMCEADWVVNQWSNVTARWEQEWTAAIAPQNIDVGVESIAALVGSPRSLGSGHGASSSEVQCDSMDEYEVATVSLDCLSRSYCRKLAHHAPSADMSNGAHADMTVIDDDDSALALLIKSLDTPVQPTSADSMGGKCSDHDDIEMARATKMVADHLSLEHGTLQLGEQPDDEEFIEQLSMTVTIERAVRGWRSCFDAITLRSRRAPPDPDLSELYHIAEATGLEWPLVALAFATDQPYLLCAIIADLKQGVSLDSQSLRALFSEATDDEYLDCVSTFHMIGAVLLQDDGSVAPGAILQRWEAGIRSPISKLCAVGAVRGVTLSQYEVLFLTSRQRFNASLDDTSLSSRVAAMEDAMRDFTASLQGASCQHASARAPSSMPSSPELVRTPPTMCASREPDPDAKTSD